MQQKLVERSVKTLDRSGDPAERREAVRHLAGVGWPEIVPHLVAALADPDASVRRQVGIIENLLDAGMDPDQRVDDAVIGPARALPSNER